MTDKRNPAALEPKRNRAAAPGSGRWPFAQMRRFFGDMDRFVDDFGFDPGHSMLPRVNAHSLPRGIWSPQIEVFERDEKLIVHADLPGLRKEDVRVEVHDGRLEISGERTSDHRGEDESGVYHSERAYGSFRRAIGLPEGVDEASVEASFDNGVLEVAMPLPKEERQTRGRSVPIAAKPEKTAPDRSKH